MNGPKGESSFFSEGTGYWAESRAEASIRLKSEGFLLLEVSDELRD